MKNKNKNSKLTFKNSMYLNPPHKKQNRLKLENDTESRNRLYSAKCEPTNLNNCTKELIFIEKLLIKASLSRKFLGLIHITKKQNSSETQV